jgi:hypothetical protein
MSGSSLSGRRFLTILLVIAAAAFVGRVVYIPGRGRGLARRAGRDRARRAPRAKKGDARADA